MPIRLKCYVNKKLINVFELILANNNLKFDFDAALFKFKFHNANKEK